MTDRELQELASAAKSAGYEFGVIHGGPRIKVDAGWTPWNPRDDDGDALRLAVKLRMNVFHAADSVYAMDQDGDLEAREGHDGNPDAATRRAVVRAAAAMATDKASPIAKTK